MTNEQTKIDSNKQLFPYCLVWTPLPLISAICPFIGHTGICTSKGIIHDFDGGININNMAFGKPTKYVPLKLPSITDNQWDDVIKEADKKYYNEIYNPISNNCHSYCAYILNQLKYNGKSNYNIIDIFLMATFKCKHVSITRFFQTYIGFIILVVIILYIYYKWV